MKSWIKRFIVIGVVLYCAVHFFNFDLRGTVSVAKTFVLDAVEKVIPGSRAQFEDIDSQISGAIVKSSTASTLNDAAQKAIRTASRLLNRILAAICRFAERFGINLHFRAPRRSGGGGNSSYSFEYASMDVTQATALRQQLIDYSMTLRGTPYVLGSETPSHGLDCSGFVRYAAKNSINVQMPRTAHEMYNYSVHIPTAEREPGDLVFFRRFGKIDHVGIYLGRYQGSGSLHGREIFINSASAGPRTGVVVSALDEPYWKRHYSSSGKFIPSSADVATAESGN